MKKVVPFLYITLWIVYIALSFYYFPVYNVSIAIPSALLLAIGSWIYGTRTGLLFLGMVSIPYHYLLMDYYGLHLEIYQAKAFGVCVQLFVVFISGTAKKLRDHAETLTTLLEEKVQNRTAELAELTNQLITMDETLKLDLAQKTHDGLGQNLTGVLLYSSSLEQSLNAECNPYTSIASSLVKKSKNNLHRTRKISRTLFPIRIVETGLDTALFEVTSYFTEVASVTFNTQLDESHNELPETVLIHVYRIIYEFILNALQNAFPTHINIFIHKKTESFAVKIEYNAEHATANYDDIRMRLIRYRLQQIEGEHSITMLHNMTKIECTIPIKNA